MSSARAAPAFAALVPPPGVCALCLPVCLIYKHRRNPGRTPSKSRVPNAFANTTKKQGTHPLGGPALRNRTCERPRCYSCGCSSAIVSTAAPGFAAPCSPFAPCLPCTVTLAVGCWPAARQRFASRAPRGHLPGSIHSFQCSRRM